MKKTIVASLLAAAAFSAHAEFLMYTDNEAGGLIQFSDMACSKITGFPKLSHMQGLGAVITDAAGRAVLLGCYRYTEPNLQVTWANGEMRFYRADSVTFTAAGKRLFSDLSKTSN
jgi:hypothetical protein